jgi:uncharacterized lipoprotein YajG
MKGKFITAPAFLALLVGCATNQSQVPQADTYPYSTQQKMQAAHHWDVLAQDVAARVKNHIDEQASLNRAISVQNAAAGPFHQGFTDLLITRMVNQGLNIRDNNEESLVLNVDTQVVSHHDRGFVRAKKGAYTTLAMLATGVWAAVNVADNSSAAADALLAGGVLGTGVAMDLTAGNIASISNKEVIINVSLMEGDRYVMRDSGIYYINEPDDGHYAQAETRSISITSE